MAEQTVAERLQALRREIAALQDRVRAQQRDHAQMQEIARLHFERAVLERRLHDPHVWG
jgi:hypothetical protein